MEGGGSVRVAMAVTPQEELKRSARHMDSKILQVALEVARQSDMPTVFVTQDVNLRVRADVLGLTSEDFQSDKVSIEELYEGWVDLDVDAAEVDALFDRGEVPVPEGSLPEDAVLHPNQYVMLRARGNASHTALSRFDAGAKVLKALPRLRKGIWGIRPRNREQQFALDLLLNDDIKLVTLVGKAGTGKTLLAIAPANHGGQGLWQAAGEPPHFSSWAGPRLLARGRGGQAQPLDAAHL